MTTKRDFIQRRSYFCERYNYDRVPTSFYFVYKLLCNLYLCPINETVWKGKFNQEITKDEHHSVS